MQKLFQWLKVEKGRERYTISQKPSGLEMDTGKRFRSVATKFLSETCFNCKMGGWIRQYFKVCSSEILK